MWTELRGEPRGGRSKLWGSGQGSTSHRNRLEFLLPACIGSHWRVFWKCTVLKDDAVCSVKNKFVGGQMWKQRDLLEITATAQGKTVMHRQEQSLRIYF